MEAHYVAASAIQAFPRMWVTKTLTRAQAANRRRSGRKPALRAWWAKYRSSVPPNAWSALAAAAAAAIGFVVVGPVKDPSNFYGIAAQVIPAFLIALAVERSLRDSMGTKADVARARRDETADGYSARGLSGGVRNTIEFALLDRQKRAIEDQRRELLSVEIGPLEIAQAASVGNWDDDPMTWRIFRDLLDDEFGIAKDDPDFFAEPDWSIDPTPGFDALRESLRSADPGQAIRWLAARAALRQSQDFSGGTVGIHLVIAEVRRLFAAQHDSELKSVLGRVTYRANTEYDRQRRQRSLSLRISIVLLTATEFAALIGVVSPGQPYSGLFVVTAALVAASIMNVAGGALADLADS